MATSKDERKGEPSYDAIPDARLRFVSDVGFGFAVGMASSSTFRFFGGLIRRSAGGRLAGAARAVRANSPRAAASMAGYLAVLSAVDTAMALARGKRDCWNYAAGVVASWPVLGPSRGAFYGALTSTCFYLELMDERRRAFARKTTTPLAAPAPAGGFCKSDRFGILELPATNLGF